MTSLLRRPPRHGSEDEIHAFNLQKLGAREGAIKGTIVAGSLMIFANWRFPWVRKQTLAGKAFLTMWGTIAGFCIYSDKYLLEWEDQHRVNEEQWRSRARSEIGAQGVVPSESMMREWKARKDEEYAEKRRQRIAAASTSAPIAGPAST